MHITDSMFNFTIDLEQFRVDNLTMGEFQRTGQDFMFDVKDHLLSEQTLRDQWFSLFMFDGEICPVENAKVSIQH